jgi:hypothetical protein
MGNEYAFYTKHGWTRKELEQCLKHGSVLGPLQDVDGDEYYTLSEGARLDSELLKKTLPEDQQKTFEG